jgi:seryl-tRNA synthetase
MPHGRGGAAKGELEQSAARLEQIQPEIQALLLAVPNLPHEACRSAPTSTRNVEVRKWGTPRSSTSR